MSLSSLSNTINYLGIFGRLDPVWEKQFNDLEKKFCRRPKDVESNNFFNHLSLVMNQNVSVGEIAKYIDLLRELKPYIPFSLKTDKVIVKEENHLALSFDINQTQAVRNLATKFINQGVVLTDYIKVVWFVLPERQAEAVEELSKIESIEFNNFVLVANKQNDENTIYSSNSYK